MPSIGSPKISPKGSMENHNEGNGHFHCTLDATLQNYIRDKLHSQVFVATYKEKRWCEIFGSYKDAVIVDPDESSLVKCLLNISKMLKNKKASFPTFSVQEDSEDDLAFEEHILWANLPNIPIGLHWFMIEEVIFSENQVLTKVKHLRSFEESLKVQGNKKKGTAENESGSELSLANIQKFFSSFVFGVLNLVRNLSMSNIQEVLRFIVISVLTFVVGLFYLAQFLSDFLLKLMRELSVLLHTLMPVILAIIRVCGQVIGATIILIYSYFRGNAPVAQIENYYRRLEGPPNFNNRNGYRRNYYSNELLYSNNVYSRRSATNYF